MSAVRPYGFRSGLGPVQIHYATPEVLANVFGDIAGISGTTRFRVETPDGRLRVKVSLLFIRRDPRLLVSSLGATIYMGEEETDQSGYLGGKVVCNDILRDSAGNIVHAASPLAIPEDPGLEGWSQEFVTAADSLLGVFTTQNGSAGVAGATGYWTLQARFQPDGQRLHDDDWDYVIRNCKITLIAPPITLSPIIP